MDGELVMERFRLRERIGSDRDGAVYRAFDERLHREVVVKELVVCDPDRVRREAQAVARLNHPAIGILYELGEHGGCPILAVERVAGRSLDEALCAGELGDRDVAAVGIDLCEALAHAHRREVVHGDVDPSHVILPDDASGGRCAKLTDFVVARPVGSAHRELCGASPYASPEERRGEPSTPASDLYSLAATLRACWTGEGPSGSMARSAEASVRSLQDCRPDLPARTVAAIDACLSPDPSLRPQATVLAEALAHDLEAFGDRIPRQAVRTDPSPDPRPALEPPSPATVAGTAAAAAPLGGVAAALGIVGAAPALCALARRRVERALLGAFAWAWIAVAVSTFGTGLEALGVWTWIAGAVLFAGAALALGEVLAARPLPVALLGAVLWASCLDLALTVVVPELGGRPLAAALAATAAIALERGVVDPDLAPDHSPSAIAVPRAA